MFKEGCIDVGFGCICYEDLSVWCVVLCEEWMIVVLLVGYVFDSVKLVLLLYDFVNDMLIIFLKVLCLSYVD